MPLSQDSQTLGTDLVLFADDTCVYTTDRKEGYVLRKFHHSYTPVEPWCVHWNVKLTEDKNQATYLSRRRRSVEAQLTLNRPNMHFVIHIKYLDIIRVCNQKFPDWVITKYTPIFGITRWKAKHRVMTAELSRLTHKIAMQLLLVAGSCTIYCSHSRRSLRQLLDTPSYGIKELQWECTAKAFRTFIHVCPLYKTKRVTLHKVLIRAVMTFNYPSWDIAADIYPLNLQCLQNKFLRTKSWITRDF
jgi:hypothetical protein